MLVKKYFIFRMIYNEAIINGLFMFRYNPRYQGFQTSKPLFIWSTIVSSAFVINVCINILLEFYKAIRITSNDLLVLFLYITQEWLFQILMMIFVIRGLFHHNLMLKLVNMIDSMLQIFEEDFIGQNAIFSKAARNLLTKVILGRSLAVLMFILSFSINVRFLNSPYKVLFAIFETYQFLALFDFSIISYMFPSCFMKILYHSLRRELNSNQKDSKFQKLRLCERLNHVAKLLIRTEEILKLINYFLGSALTFAIGEAFLVIMLNVIKDTLLKKSFTNTQMNHLFSLL